jgi:hypothetical protein
MPQIGVPSDIMTYYTSTQNYAGRPTPRLTRPARLVSEQLIVIVDLIVLT